MKRRVDAAACTTSRVKKKAKNASSAFARTEFVLGQYVSSAEQSELAALITAQGGKVVATPRRQTDFLVQSHAAEQCDERINACVELGVLGVPPSFVRACAEAGHRFLFREWAMVNPADRRTAQVSDDDGDGFFAAVSPYLNPRLDPALLFFASTAAATHCSAAQAGHTTTPEPRHWLLGAKELGNVDFRGGEREELNQSVADFVLQKWPALGDAGRDTIYVQPMDTQSNAADASAAAASASAPGGVRGQLPNGAGGHSPSADPTDAALLKKVTAFLSAYFGCKVKTLPPLPLLLRQKAPKKAKKTKKSAAKGEVVTEAAVVIEAAGVEVGVEVKQGAMHGAESVSACLSVVDLLDVMEEVLPGDAYCVLGITDQFIYEGEDIDGHMLGRAFGGSRIAMFTTAVYGHALALQAAAGGGGAACATLRPLAHLLATIGHETGHCFGLDHCGFYRCCMNSWADGVSEFALEPIKRTAGRNQKEQEWAGDVEGTMHVCPICVRKLQASCGFDMRQRYTALGAAYDALGLVDQVMWCREVVERGDVAAAQKLKK
jgi:hypothetical protein